MDKIKVSIAGEGFTQRQLDGLKDVYKALEMRSDQIELKANVKEEYEEIMLDEDNSFDNVTELLLTGIEQSEVCVVVAPSIQEGGFCSLGWILGYCWSQGVQVVLMELTEDAEKIHPLAGKAVQAHLTRIDQLFTYDFEDMPYVPDPKR